MAEEIMPESEMWRYTAISPEPQIARPDDWFSPDEYVACRIWRIWTAARIIELGGGSPQTLMICASQEDRLCKPPDKCESWCKKRFWASVSQGDVLGKEDLLRVLADPNPFDPLGSYCGRVGHQKAQELFNRIEQLETRQKSY